MADRNLKWMTISGITGFAFFLIANFTNFFESSNIIAGCLQVAINIFVFVVWTKAFLQSSGFKKFVAFFGVVVPIVMMSITLVRVLIPVLLSS